MSYFNFLSPDLQDDVPDDEATNAENQAFERSHAEAKKNPVRVNLDAETTGATHDFQKERAKLTDFAKKEALSAVDRLESSIGPKALQQATAEGRPVNGLGQGWDYEGVQQKLRASSPDQYATIIYNEAAKHLQGKQLDDVMRPVEDAVQNYKRLTIQQQPEQVQAIQSSLAAQDTPGKVERIAQIDKSIDKANKDLQIAASPRQAKEIKDNIKFLSEQRARYGLNLQQQQSEEPKQPDPTTTPNSSAPVSEYLGALGVDKEKQVNTAQQALQIMGVHPDKMDEPVPTHAGLMRVLSALDPKGTFAQQLADEMAQAKQQDAQDNEQYDKEGKRVEGQMADTQKKLDSREARMKQLYQQLNETPFMQTWPGIIMYVITGMLVGPGIATKLFGNLDNRRAIGNELAQLKFDIRRYDRQMEMQERHQADIRSAAIHRMEHREDRDLTYSRDLGKMVLQHNLILSRESARHPDQANTYKQLGSAYVRERQQMQDAQHRKDEAQRILSNDFSEEGLKKKAQQDMQAAERDVQFYRQRALWLDSKIKELGGVAIPEEAESTQ